MEILRNLKVIGFKGEWMAVKDSVLYVGGLGKVWTSRVSGRILNHVTTDLLYHGVTRGGWMTPLQV